MKTCSTCKQSLDASCYHKSSKSSDGLQAKCKECISLYNRKAYESNKDHHIAKAAKWQNENRDKYRMISAKHRQKLGKEGKRAKEIKRIYGITLEQYKEMHASQSGVCAICKGTTNWKNREGELVIDHDHTTRQVRGLLCHPCNTALGMMADSTERLQAAISYLKQAGNF